MSPEAKKPFEELSPQEQLTFLKAQRAEVGEQMMNEKDAAKFAKLFVRSEQLDQRIDSLQESIEPDRGHGTVGQESLRNAHNPRR